MLTKEHKILIPFIKQPWKEFTYKQIKEQTKNKSDNYTYTTLKKFVKQKILKTKKIGNIILYEINNNESSLNVIGFLSEQLSQQTKHLPHKNLQKIIDKINTSFFSLIITGSYAKNKQTKNSDLDIMIICDDKRNPKSILSEIKLETELMIPEIHTQIFRQKDFFQMLINKEENYGKEVVRANLSITGAKAFYKIILDAKNHGFNE